MNLQHRIDLLTRLGEYILSDDPEWEQVKLRAHLENGWFTPEFIDLALKNIGESFLKKETLEEWANDCSIQEADSANSKVGIVMAGNIPLVGFHDWLCVFISGNTACIKASSKDKVLITHVTEKIGQWGSKDTNNTYFSEMLKNCDAYIATGSNNTSRYFDYYFSKYPHIIRRNRTSVGILSGKESREDLEKLTDDIFQFFGLGCRNVTKIYVPDGYDFTPLLEISARYSYLSDHHKYKNNYDYNLALLLLNKSNYLTNNLLLLVENPSFFSPISLLHYEYYDTLADIEEKLRSSKDVQCICGKDDLPFGKAQSPALSDYADKIDTMHFLTHL